MVILINLTDLAGNPVVDYVGVPFSAAILAALLTAWVASRLATDADYRRLRGAMWIVQVELTELAARIKRTDDAAQTRAKGQGKKVEGATDYEIRKCVLLGDWVEVKAEMAALDHYDHKLLRSVASLYAEVSDFKENRGGKRPEYDEVLAVATCLRHARDGMKLGRFRPRIIYAKQTCVDELPDPSLPDLSPAAES